MITVVNFSHPLSPEARDKIASEWGGGDVRVVDVKVQIDFAVGLAAQCELIAALAVNAVGGNPLNIDCVILPGLSAAAGYIARRFAHANIIVISQVAGSTPVRFMPTELIRAKPWR